MSEFSDEAVVQLLADSSVQAGLRQVDRAVERCRCERERGEGEGKRLVTHKGITAAFGDCVYAIMQEGGYRPLTVFTFRLTDVATPGFADSLQPRRIFNLVEYLCAGASVNLERPDAPITVTLQDVKCASRDGLGARDKTAFDALVRKQREQSRAADMLTTYWYRLSFYKDEPISTFEDAAFGDRRQAILEEVIKPLRVEEARLRQLGRYGHAVELANRISMIEVVMRANPTMVDAVPLPIFDICKAEYVARRVKTSFRNPALVAARAACEYDADPIGAYEGRNWGWRRHFS